MAELKVLHNKPPVNEDVVVLLRNMLSMAEDGKLNGIAVCYQTADRRFSTSIVSNGDRFALCHGVGALWWRFHQILQDDAEPVVFDKE